MSDEGIFISDSDYEKYNRLKTSDEQNVFLESLKKESENIRLQEVSEIIKENANNLVGYIVILKGLDPEYKSDPHNDDYYHKELVRYRVGNPYDGIRYSYLLKDATIYRKRPWKISEDTETLSCQEVYLHSYNANYNI